MIASTRNLQARANRRGIVLAGLGSAAAPTARLGDAGTSFSMFQWLAIGIGAYFLVGAMRKAAR